MTRPTSTASFLVLATMLANGSARAADEGMPGRLLLVRPGSLAKVIARAAPGDTFGLPSGASDPTVGGGQVQIFKGDRADVFELPVQAAPYGWRGLGSPAGSRGFKYRGRGTTTDPCRVVLVKERIVKAVCKGGAIRLDPPANGPVGMLLTVGTTPGLMESNATGQAKVVSFPRTVTVLIPNSGAQPAVGFTCPRQSAMTVPA